MFPSTLDGAEVVSVLEAMNYERCEGPGDRVYDYQGNYRIETKVVKMPEHQQELRCTFHDLHAKKGDETFFASRRGPRMGWVREIGGFLDRKFWSEDERSQGSFFFDRIQLGNDRDIHAEVQECLVLLDSFVHIQNALIERTRSGHRAMPLLTSRSEKEDQRAAEKAEREAKEKGGLGAGYIVLIIAGALALLGGGYYMYTQMTGGSDEPRERRHRRRRGNDSDSV
jgi:hypothetical protein